MAFTTSLDDLRALAASQGSEQRELAELHLAGLERSLWCERKAQSGRLALPWIKQKRGVEFAFWALPACTNDTDGRDIDRAGRLIACHLVQPILSGSLANAVVAVDAPLWLDCAAHFGRDALIEATRPVAEWHGWLIEIDERMETVAWQHYMGTAMRMALDCAKGLLIPSCTWRDDFPLPDELGIQGRFCAFSAYYDALDGWAVGTEGYRAAHELLDLAVAAGVGDETQEAMEDRLADLRGTLVVRAESVLAEHAEGAFRMVIERER